MCKTDSQWESGKDWREKEKGRRWMQWLDSITASMGTDFSKLLEIVEDRRAWHSIVHWVAKTRPENSNWITRKWKAVEHRGISSVLCDDLEGWEVEVGGRLKKECTYIYMCVCVYLYIYTHVCIYIYILYMYMYTYNIYVCIYVYYFRAEINTTL